MADLEMPTFGEEVPQEVPSDTGMPLHSSGLFPDYRSLFPDYAKDVARFTQNTQPIDATPMPTFGPMPKLSALPKASLIKPLAPQPVPQEPVVNPYKTEEAPKPWGP